jgi:hypothetical protein
MPKVLGEWEYKIVDEGSDSQFTKKLAEVEGEGFELKEFRTDGNWIVYHYVALLRRRRNGSSAS